MPRASIVIRARNEERFLGETLEAIRSQEYLDFEVLVVDSGSTDRTPEIARRAGAHLIHLDQRQFTYGRALNLGIAEASGELLVSLSAHALPASSRWLGSLLAPFGSYRIAGVYGRHIPRANASPLELFGMHLTGIASPKPRLETTQLRFSNTNGAFRRSTWERFHFDETLPGAEDLAWAQRVHAAGYHIFYEPAAGVYHSHGEPLHRMLVRQLKDQSVRVRLLLRWAQSQRASRKTSAPKRALGEERLVVSDD